jgi:hypothetical protein
MTIGKVYRVQGDVFVDGGGDVVFLRVVPAPDLNSTAPVSVASSSNASYDIAFVATATTMYVGGINVAPNPGDYFELDNVSVREIDPLSVSIQMQGRMTYADEGLPIQLNIVNWVADANNEIRWALQTFGADVGQAIFIQDQTAYTQVELASAADAYSPGINVPFNIASRHGSTFINGAVDGTALTANTTPVALPDLSATNLNLAFDYMGTIRLYRMWDQDLGDGGIAAASAPSLEPSLSLLFDGSGNSFTIDDWSA